MDWFFDTISAHLFLVSLVPLCIGLAVLLTRDRLLKASGLPREEWPRFFTHRTITPTRNKFGFVLLCVYGLGRVFMGIFEKRALSKAAYICEGLALVLAAFIIYRRTRRDIERAVTTPIDPN
jgi:hypothetical protein